MAPVRGRSLKQPGTRAHRLLQGTTLMAKPYPWYYAVSDRPVKIVEMPNGGVDALVFDFATGSFLSDRSYFARVAETGIGKDVDQLTVRQFQELVADLRR